MGIHRFKIGCELLRRSIAARVVLAKEVPQCQGKLALGEAVGIAMAGYAVGREQLSAGFVLTEIFLRSCWHDGHRDDDERRQAAD